MWFGHCTDLAVVGHPSLVVEGAAAGEHDVHVKVGHCAVSVGPRCVVTVNVLNAVWRKYKKSIYDMGDSYNS